MSRIFVRAVFLAAFFALFPACATAFDLADDMRPVIAQAKPLEGQDDLFNFGDSHAYARNPSSATPARGIEIRRDRTLLLSMCAIRCRRIPRSRP